VDDSNTYTGNIFYFMTKKHHVEILEQDIELCPSCHFPVTIAGKEEAYFLSRFLGFHTFIICCFSLC
jgi:hypothetical protein